MSIFLVGPDNWFDLPDAARAAWRTAQLELRLTADDGTCPLTGVRLDELNALHNIFGSWWSTLGDPRAQTSLEPGDYDRLLASSRALVKRRAEALAADPGGAISPPHVYLDFPPLGHSLLAAASDALVFLEGFLALTHPPSLIRWSRDMAIRDDAAAACRDNAWLRIVLQKIAAEDELPEAVACLRLVYGVNEQVRQELLSAEVALLDQASLAGCRVWTSRLGLDRPARHHTAFHFPTSSPARSSDAKSEVTVVVPSYCHADFIEAAVESALAQRVSAEIRVVDDRSTDATVERVRRIRDPRLRIDVNDRNMGLGDSILCAVGRIDTPLVAILNSDDVFHPDRLERCLDVFHRSPGVQVVATDCVPIDASGCRIDVGNVRRAFDGGQIADWVEWFAAAPAKAATGDLFSALLERNFLITSSNIVVRTPFLRSHTEALRGLKYCFDWQVFLNAAASGALVHLREDLLGYRLHGTNTVWFDDDRRAGYVLEVNRVLASALRQKQDDLETREDIDALAQQLERLVNHAAKHSEANGLTLYAVNTMGGRRLEEARQCSAEVRSSLQVMSGVDGAADPQPDPSSTTALKILADIAREERTIARASERQAQEVAAAAVSERQRMEADVTEQARALAALTAQVNSQGDELDRLRSSAEWRIGNTLWNGIGLSRIGRPAIHVARTVRDRRNRWGLSLGRALGRGGLARPRAVVAACWGFPIHSHTFVYQEMQALEWAGLEPRVFCCTTNPRSELHPAFERLWDKRVVLESHWSFNRDDLEYFRRTRPDRVDALLAKLAEATGRTREALLQESTVMMGFTFARHVELSGATYLHTYFFYDQSFLALMAGYLLGVPRGVTTYADHMMADYAFKCVPLHLELADVVVATSQRIKRELSAIGGGRFDDKIIVKPNGIDTGRFPFVDPERRLSDAGPPELVAVNRIEPKKGLTYLVEAAGLLTRKGVDIRVNIVGGADPTPAGAACLRELTARIQALQLEDRVILHGVKKQPEFLPLLARSRIFVAPYVEVASGDKDGIPTAVLEGMSTGLPVIATDAGSIVEAVADGVEALLVPQRNAERLADAIERLLSDRAQYIRMSNAARQRAVSQFDSRVTEKTLHARVRSCLDRVRPSGC